MDIVLKLTKEQAESLSEILWNTQDEGPIGGGWASEDLDGFRSMVDDAIENAKNKKA